MNTEDYYTFHLFVRPKDPKVEQWEGSRSGTQAVIDVFNADKVYAIQISDRLMTEFVAQSGDIKDIERNLSRIVADASEVYTDASPSTSSTSAFSRLFSSRSPSKTDSLSKLLDQATVKPLKSILNELRNIKSDAEIANMRMAGKASGRAFTEAMRQAWTTEKDLNAFLEYTFKKNGCDTSAYVPVVAGGKVEQPGSHSRTLLMRSRTQVRSTTFAMMMYSCMTRVLFECSRSTSTNLSIATTTSS